MPYNCTGKSNHSKKGQLGKLENWLLEVVSLSKEQIFEQKSKYRRLENATLSFPPSIYVTVMSLTYSNLNRERGTLWAI